MPKHFIPSVLVTLLFTALSCTEGQYTGGSIQPPGDVVSTDTASFFLTTETVKVDSILYKNSVALLGEFTDAFFGTTKAEFLAQVYCPLILLSTKASDESILLICICITTIGLAIL
jgi:hypothetical protein